MWNKASGLGLEPDAADLADAAETADTADLADAADRGQGLGAALGSLLETVRRPTTLKAADLPRFPARVEECVRFCLATLLRGWPDGEMRVLISVSSRDGRLGVVLFDPETTDIAHIATAARWEAVASRIAALKGTVASGPNFGGVGRHDRHPCCGEERRTVDEGRFLRRWRIPIDQGSDADVPVRHPDRAARAADAEDAVAGRRQPGASA
jgi:hypothetical protein